MEILFALVDQTATQSESYFFLNFESTQNDILWLYNTFLSEGKVCELYPVAAKFGKQLEYADKKGMTYAVILGDGEKEKNSYVVKNMKTGNRWRCRCKLCSFWLFEYISVIDVGTHGNASLYKGHVATYPYPPIF